MTIACKKTCKNFAMASKALIYQSGGCYCRICKRYFKLDSERCPCCNMKTRHNTRDKTHHQQDLLRVS